MLGVAEPWLWIQVTPTRRGGACQCPIPLGRIAGWAVTVQEAARALSPYNAPWPGPPLSASQNGQRNGGRSRGWRVARASFLPPRPRSWRVCRAGSRSRLPSARDTTEVREKRGALAFPPQPHPCYLAAIGSTLFSPQGKRPRHTPALRSPGGGPMSLGVWCGGSFHSYSADSEA